MGLHVADGDRYLYLGSAPAEAAIAGRSEPFNGSMLRMDGEVRHEINVAAGG